jgi:hypothetical protein
MSFACHKGVTNVSQKSHNAVRFAWDIVMKNNFRAYISEGIIGKKVVV